MSTGDDKLLRVSKLVVEYRQEGGSSVPLTAVRGVSLEIGRGEILALVGESGSGKTSLAHAVLGLLPAAGGRVMLQGRDLARMDRTGRREARRLVQPVFQDPLASLSPRRTVLQTLLEPLDHFRIGARGARRQKASSALRDVGLDDVLLQRYPHELSGGQRQRVALARALVSEPALVVADEPVSSLDVPQQARIVRLVRDLRERLGLSFLFVSHDLSVVRHLADSVAVMYAGRLVENAPAAHLFESPAHPYTRALLRAVPQPDPLRTAPIPIGGEAPSPLTPPSGCVFHKRCTESLPECADLEPDERPAGPGEETHRVSCHLWKP